MNAGGSRPRTRIPAPVDTGLSAEAAILRAARRSSKVRPFASKASLSMARGRQSSSKRRNVEARECPSA